MIINTVYPQWQNEIAQKHCWDDRNQKAEVLIQSIFFCIIPVYVPGFCQQKPV